MPNPPFPTFTNGIVSSLDGYAEEDLLYSTVEVLDSGYGNAFAWNSNYDNTGAFHNFQEERFSVVCTNFTQSEVQTLETFFATMNGPYGYFTFTDDQNVTWDQCQFDQETLEFQYLGPNQFTTECKILAVVPVPFIEAPLNDEQPPVTPPPPIASVFVVMTTSYTNNIAGHPAGSGGFASASGLIDINGTTWLGLQGGHVEANGPWTLRTDSFAIQSFGIPPPSSLTGLHVKFSTAASLNQAGFADFLIYDVHAHVTYVDSSVADIHPASVSASHVGADGGTLANTFAAIDTDMTTFAEVTRSISGSLLHDITSFDVTWA